MTWRFDVIHFSEHNPAGYRGKIKGQRALRLFDEDGEERGELVWRVAHGHSVEICEMGLYRGGDRRRGWGRRLMEEGLKDMQHFFSTQIEGMPLRRIYLFTEAKNDGARAFYQACGFAEEAVLPDFYDDGDAILCVKALE